MNPQIHNDSARLKRIVALYNMIPNLFWSAINLIPIFIFCYRNMNVRLVYIFSALSLLTTLLPRKFFYNIQLGNSISVYKKIGVKFINKFTQNGDLINSLIRKKFPLYNVISNKNLSHKKLLQQTYMIEKFHFAMLSFFTLTTIFSLLHKYFWWALVISFTNLVYNVYPNLLQQYIRIRLSSFSNKKMEPVSKL